MGNCSAADPGHHGTPYPSGDHGDRFFHIDVMGVGTGTEWNSVCYWATTNGLLSRWRAVANHLKTVRRYDGGEDGAIWQCADGEDLVYSGRRSDDRYSKTANVTR